jgi:hypothetical protein
VRGPFLVGCSHPGGAIMVPCEFLFASETGCVGETALSYRKLVWLAGASYDGDWVGSVAVETTTTEDAAGLPSLERVGGSRPVTARYTSARWVLV